jgi:SagB-type dehydrogenase family enzyme
MTVLLRLSDAVQVAPDGVRRDGVKVPLGNPLLLASLYGGMPVERVAEVQGSRAVQALHRAGMLEWHLPGVGYAQVLARGHDLVVPQQMPGEVPLSRFTVLHRDSGGWVLEGALSQWRVHLTAHGVALVTGVDEQGWLAGLLSVTGMLDGSDEAAADWSLHDLLFLARTHETLPFLSTPARQRGVSAEPALREPVPGVPLPAAEGPEPGEPALWEATESRRTIRDFAPRPVSLNALGRLLWRTLRVVSRIPADEAESLSYEALWRPVPSGGAMHASDLWLFCSDVDGLEPGAYRYDPSTHAVIPVADALPTMPAPVVGLISARHKRTAWKYEPIALSLELKDVGVQMMALQLTAPVVGLSVVPVGSGSTTEAAALLGIDPLTDAPIGEFLLGAV